MKCIATNGHGYLSVTRKQVETAVLQGFNPSSYSFYNSKVALLEEDCDMGAYLKIVHPDNNFTLKIIYQNDINRNCYERF